MSNLSNRWLNDNVPRRQQEVVKVTRIEGNLVSISAKGGVRQIRRLHNTPKTLKAALNVKNEVTCLAHVNQRGMLMLIGVAP
jgi:hypothetical protein